MTAPASRDSREWLPFLAQQRSLLAVWDEIPDDAKLGVVAYAVGKWIREHEQDGLAARIDAEFERLEAVLPA